MAVGSLGDGLASPMMLLIASYVINDIGSNSTATTFITNINLKLYMHLYLAAKGDCWTRTGEQQASRMRARNLSAILQQDVAYFDLKGASMAEVPNFISNFTAFIAGYNKAAVVVEQAVSSISTVYAFRAERRTANSFSTNLKSSVRIGLQQGVVKSLALGCAGISFSIWAFIVCSAYIVGISVVASGLYFGSCISNLKYFGDAVSAVRE
ncbi:putative multidrug resistance protein [Platanthera guangdongensis]|uniref:Multidrug resistance protein n=1 Tax=Platanthera guangdongensis TaxID=2320717 RepID=A0ABR2MEC0_9ASPA